MIDSISILYDLEHISIKTSCQNLSTFLHDHRLLSSQSSSPATPQRDYQVLVHIHHQHHKVAHHQGQSMNKLRLLAVVLGAKFSETEVRKGDKKSVENPKKDDVESVERISVEWLSKGL